MKKLRPVLDKTEDKSYGSHEGIPILNTVICGNIVSTVAAVLLPRSSVNSGCCGQLDHTVDFSLDATSD